MWFITVVLAENGRLRNADTIFKRYTDLTMAHRGEVKAIVTTVIVSPIMIYKTLCQYLFNWLSLACFPLFSTLVLILLSLVLLDCTLTYCWYELLVILSICQPLPAEEEKELKETLQHILGKGKTVKLEQKVICIFLAIIFCFQEMSVCLTLECCKVENEWDVPVG